MLYGYTFYSLCCIQDEQEKDLCIRLSKEHPKEKVDHTDITSTKNCICPDCQCIVRAFGKFIDLPSLLDQQSLYTRKHLEIGVFFFFFQTFSRLLLFSCNCGKIDGHHTFGKGKAVMYRNSR